MSGQQPGTTDALRFFSPVAGKRAGVAGTGVTFGNLGNPDLKPERSREIELGFDAALFKDRVSLEFTYFNKKTNDALIERERVAGRWAPPRSSSSTWARSGTTASSWRSTPG